MSSFYGIWNRDGKPVDKEEARKISEAFGWWGPDENDYIVNGPLFMGQATLWNTPESKYEHLPLEKDGCILVADARIDNRDELVDELVLPDRPTAEIGDSEFILAAYKKWGEECADRLIGDFAFVIWDEKKQELFCARDFMGIRPLYYFANDRRFIFGSDLKSFVEIMDIPLTIRDQSVANYVAYWYLVDRKHTFFEEIYRLEDGCHMTFSEKRFRYKRYWDIRNSPKYSLPDMEAYRQKFRKLFERAIDDRLRTDYPVSSHLSGGLDSSPIAVYAARELHKKGERLNAYSWHVSHGPEVDWEHHEWKHPKQIAQREEIDLHYIDMDYDENIRVYEKYDIALDQFSYAMFEEEIREKLLKNSARTMLSGWGGDEFSTYHGYAVKAELFSRGKWIEYLKILLSRGENPRFGHGIKALFKIFYFDTLVPLMPKFLYCHLPKIRCKTPDYSFFKDDFIPLILENEKNKSYPVTYRNARTTQEDYVRSWKNGHLNSRITAWSQEAIPYKFRYTYPLLDRRIIEFCYHLPAEYLTGKGFDRYLYRQVIENLIEHDIIWWKHKDESLRIATIKRYFFDCLEIIVSKKESNLESSQYLKKIKITRNIKNHKITAYTAILCSKYLNINR